MELHQSSAQSSADLDWSRVLGVVGVFSFIVVFWGSFGWIVHKFIL